MIPLNGYKEGSGDSEGEAGFFDAVLKGIDNAFHGKFLEPFFVIGSSRKLRQSMKEDGRDIPDGYAAHHIVPENDVRFPEATEARKILESFGIDLDSSPNGVGLPHKVEIPEGGYHPGIHTRKYYRGVRDLLRTAKTKDQAAGILRDIGDRLSRGEFPK